MKRKLKSLTTRKNLSLKKRRKKEIQKELKKQKQEEETKEKIDNNFIENSLKNYADDSNIKNYKILKNIITKLLIEEEQQKRKRKKSRNFFLDFIKNDDNDDIENYNTESLIRVSILIHQRRTSLFLLLPFNILTACTKNIETKINALGTEFDNINLILQQLSLIKKLFKKFVRIAKICTNLFDIVATRRDSKKIKLGFIKNCIDCQTSFSLLNDEKNNYLRQLKNVDLQLVQELEKNIDNDYVDSCLKNFSTFSKLKIN
jgi:hypothetical protein